MPQTQIRTVIKDFGAETDLHFKIQSTKNITTDQGSSRTHQTYQKTTTTHSTNPQQTEQKLWSDTRPLASTPDLAISTNAPLFARPSVCAFVDLGMHAWVWGRSARLRPWLLYGLWWVCGIGCGRFLVASVWFLVSFLLVIVWCLVASWSRGQASCRSSCLLRSRKRQYHTSRT